MDEFRSVAKSSRRQFIGSAVAAGSLLLPSSAARAADEGKDEEVSTNEDLMREHGILKRVLIAYDEIIRRIRAGQDFPPQAVTDGATIIRKFIEDYHEKLEEDHLFPRFVRPESSLTWSRFCMRSIRQAGGLPSALWPLLPGP